MNIRSAHICFAGLLVLVSGGASLRAADTPPQPIYVAVFDFATTDGASGNAQVLKGRPYGVQLADAVRLKLRRQGKGWAVIDRHTLAKTTGKIDENTPPAKVKKLLAEQFGAHVGVYGTVRKVDQTVRAEINCIDLRAGNKPVWSKVFHSDDRQRARAVLAREIVEAITGRELWQPTEYGDEPEPPRRTLGRPINVNGTFDAGAKGWDAPDNVSTFLAKGPAGRGTILRVRTNLRRDPWLAYRKALRAGKTNPAKPPAIGTDTSYGSVAGLEGVHYRSDWIPAKPSRRYWLVADSKNNTKRKATPKIFVKGFKKTPHALDGLPESSLTQFGLSPKDFAALPEAKRKELIADDAKKHPMRYVRECYRWYLACPSQPGKWSHFAAPFPPRGGLPKDVEFLQIQIYSYWPPGEYLWDNVLLFEAPTPQTK